MASGESELGAFEKAALALSRWINENESTKRAQYHFNRRVTLPWVRRAIGRRVFVDNIEWLLRVNEDRGLLFAANHRSFFDQWVNMLSLFHAGDRWSRRIGFPVRSNFFYEKPAGVLVNYLLSLGAMYPPIYRDRSRADLNKDAVSRIIEYAQRPGSVVGIHPEGRRNTGDDPYTLLKAQPGIGEIALKADPLIVPVFINGLGNDIVQEVISSQSNKGRRRSPIILVYGSPVDLSEFAGEMPRAAVYKRVADKILDAVKTLIPREQELRKRAVEGAISDDDPGWLINAR